MKKTVNSKFIKAISFVLALLMVVGVVPIHRGLFEAAATAGDRLCLQVIRSGAVVKNDEKFNCTITNSDSSFSYAGTTGASGVWETDYVVGDDYAGDNDFTVSVGTKTVAISKDLRTAEKYFIYDLNDGSVSWSENAVTKAALISVASVSDITGLSNGTEKTAAAFGLPETVNVITTAGEKELDVTWGVEASKYDPAIHTAQEFVVNGTILLDDETINPDSVSLLVSVTVSVNADDDATVSVSPGSVSKKAGETVVLVAYATLSDGAFTWYKGNKVITGENKSELTIKNITSDDAGEYKCAVKGLNGNTIFSNSVNVSVDKLPVTISLTTSEKSMVRPVKKGLVLSVNGIPTDAKGTVTFYAGSEVISSGTDNKVTFVPAKENDYRFRVVFSGDEKYSSASDELDFSFVKGAQSALSFKSVIPSEIWIGDISFAVRTNGGSGDGDVVYSIVEQKDEYGKESTGIARITTNGTVFVEKVGEFKIEVKKLGDNDYNDSDLLTSDAIKVVKRTQSNFEFDIAAPETIKFNENNNEFVNAANGGSGSGEITYSVSDKSIAEIDAVNPSKIHIKKAGTVIVTALRSGGEKYLDAKASYTLTVEKADQVIEFAEDAPKEIFYGQDLICAAKEREDASKPDGKGYGSGEITYSISEGQGIASIDEKTGKLIFADEAVGLVTVKAKKTACDSYNEAVATYSFEVKPFVIDGVPYEIGGETKNESGWYTSDITVTAVTGYTLSASKSRLDSNSWDNRSLVISKEGVENGITLYFRSSETGAISEGVTLENDKLKIDKEKPYDLAITYSNEYWWEDIAKAVMFGTYDSNISFTVEARDAYSGIERFEWEYNRDKNAAENIVEHLEGNGDAQKNGENSYSATFTLPITDISQIRGKISFSAFDIAGWQESFEDTRLIIIDTMDPAIDIAYEGDYKGSVDKNNKEVPKDSENARLVYGSDIKAKISVKEANFWPEIVNVTLDGNDVFCTWDKDSDCYVTEVDITGDGEHTLCVTALDATYNNVADKDKHKVEVRSCVLIDTVSPSVDIKDPQSSSEPKNGKYFSDDASVEIVINEENFNPDGVVVSVETTNAEGEKIGISDDFGSLVKNPNNWASDGAEHILTLNFVESARYILSVAYTDLAGLRSSKDLDEFVIDKTAPNKSDIVITYNEEDIVNKLANILYFRTVRITVTASDDISGIDRIEWGYEKTAGVSEANVEAASGIVEHKNLHRIGESKYSALIKIPRELVENEQFDGKFNAEAFNMAGLGSENVTDERRVIVDSIAPGRSVNYGTPHIVSADTATDKEYFSEGENVKLFYAEKAELKLTINEANFYAEDINTVSDALNGLNCKVTVVKDSGAPCDLTPTNWESDGDNHTGSIFLDTDGEYTITIDYTDRSGNVMEQYTTPLIIVDSVAPVISGTISPEGRYGTDKREIHVAVNEKNFRASDFDILIKEYDLDGAETVKTVVDEWIHNGDEHTLTFIVDNESRYAVTVNGKDLSLNEAESFTFDEFVIDRTKPEIKSIEYKTPVNEAIINAVTFGYFNPSVEVTITAHDGVSGVDKILCNYLRANGVSSVNEESWSDSFAFEQSDDLAIAQAVFILPEKSYNGHFSGDAIDRASNSTVGTNGSYTDGKYRVVVDSTAPEWLESYISAEQYINEATLDVIDTPDKTSDTWFAISQNEAIIKFKINEANFYSEDFNDAGTSFNNMNCTVTLSKDGGAPYPVTAEWSDEGDVHFGTVVISEEGDYRLNVSYSDRSGNAMNSYISPKIVIDRTAPVISAEYNSTMPPNNGNCYRKDVNVTITVKERYFRAEDMAFSLTEAKDVSGKIIDGFAEIEDNFLQALKDRNNWSSSGDIHTATITFSTDANYAFALNCTDVAGNSSEQFDSEKFTVDKTSPYGITIDYSEPRLSAVISAVTFNYYNPSATVTITASDDTSGIDSISWNYNRADGASGTNVVSDSGVISDLDYFAGGRIATGKFVLPYSGSNGQYYGNITVSAVDKAGNSSPEYRDDGTMVVIDTIAPTREVEFSPAKQVLQASDNSTFANYNYKTEGSKYKIYYDATATATIRINEANFYPEDVIVKVNGERTNISNWSQSGDLWTGTLNFAKDGHYVVTIEYTDRSQNGMVSYVSNEVIVDTVDPVIKVTYSPDKVIKTIDKRKYYDNVQKATITITEHNFRASDVAAVVTATDISGAKVNVENYAEYLKKESSWSASGDVHTATITYSADANYTFDIDYIDLALRKAADYPEDSFSVDTTAPENLKIAYSTSVLDTVINSVAFSFYNSKVRATITARDITSGVNSFKYSYIKAAGVSAVNAELIDQEISESNISYSDGGKTATAYFDIPRQVLDVANQFKGTVRFSATDRAGNVSETLADNRTLVVDNIAPVAQITFNQPVGTVNGVSYYSGDIVASIQITEANFYPEDVVVTVNGSVVSTGKWSQSGDVWSSTLTISADGEYKVAVSYRDRSKNTMPDYESGQLVIDRTKPVVTVSGIKNESANKGERIGFRISATDTNLDIAEFKPQLTAVVMNENGAFVTESINLGSIQTVESGKSYFCTVENLEKDAIYTLTCKTTDRSGNVNDVMIVSDSGKAQLARVMFSVNRNGSTFMLDNYTRSIVDKYYLGSIDNNIVIIETNVDQLTSHEVKLNQKTLVQGKDYTITRSGGGDTWNKYTYSIDSELFATEGEYNVVVSSVDKAETMSFSDIRNAEVSFLVDKTAPSVTVSGLTKDGRYQTDKQLVTIIPTDDAGKIYSIKVVVKDDKGTVIAIPIDLSGNELISELEANGNKLTFELGEGMYQNVEIICTDKSGNEYVSGNDYFNVTVSPSGWIILWVNPVFKWSFFSAIGAAILIIFFIIFFRRRKKNESK